MLQELDETFIDQERLSSDELSRAAIKGILEYLDDPYTSYLSEDRYQNFAAGLDGISEEFQGIGAVVTMRQDQIMILGPLPDSPAGRAGILPGDIVLEVDGESTDGLDLFQAVDLIRGPKGSTVVLGVLRAGTLRPIELSVVRDTIEVSSVQTYIPEPGIGYVGLGSFDSKSAEGLREEIASLRESGAKGLVLDLRNNTGGLVEAAVAVVSEFVESGLVFIWRNFDGSEQEFEVTGDGTAFDLPLVVIVNGFSASASEIVSGALQDHDRATIVGTKTFGKGSVNILTELSSGAGLYVTTANWLTPGGRMIEGEGLEPDVEVGNAIDIQAAQRVGALTQALCAAFEEERDELEAENGVTKAVETLCRLDPEPQPAPEGDEQLDIAIAELRKAMAN